MKQILLVEDDAMLGRLLSEKLGESYHVYWKANKTEALQFLASHHKLDLIILDVGLPDGNGFEIADFIKGTMTTPFIFLTAQSDANSRLLGYEKGADEYIPKPFHLKELLIKVEHIFEQHRHANHLVLSNCQIDFNEMSLKKNDGSIQYPATNDLRVLQALVEASPLILTRDEILNRVWGTDITMNYRTVDNTIVRLKKLLGPENEELIRSVRSIGYQWTVKDQK